jgi:hypothetical protein
MADLVLSVDVTSLADARKKLDGFQKAMNGLSVNQLASGVANLQGKIKQLVEAQAKGNIGASAYNKGLLQLKRAYEQLGYSSQQATAAVRQYAAQLQNQAAAQQAARAAEELARAQAQAAARTRELRLRFQEGYAAFDRARKQMRDLREAMRQGIITTEQYKEAVRRLREEQTRATAATERLGQQSGVLRQRMSRASVAVQQFGYQTGDFLVQVQSGTNAFVAFGQQATQLAGLLTMSMNPATVALGAALSIVIPLTTAVAAGFMRARKDAEKAAEETFNFVDALRELEEISDRENLFRGVGLSVQREFEPLRDFLEAGIMEEVREQFARTGTQLTAGFESGIRTQLSAIQQYNELLLDLRNQASQTGMTEGIRLALQDVNSLISQANNELDKQNASWSIIRSIAGSTREEFARSFADAVRRLETEELMTQEVRDSLFAFAEANGLAGELARLLGQAADNAQRVTDSLPRAIPLSAQPGRLAAIGGMAAGPRYTPEGRGAPMSAQPSALGVVGAFATAPGQGRTSSGGGAEGPNAIERLQQEIAFRQRTLNLSKEEKALQTEIFRITNALGKDRNKYSSDFIANLAQQNLAIQEQERVIEDARQQQEQLADSIANSFGDAFMSIVDGTKSTKDAFKQMAAAIVRDLYQVYVMKRLIGSAEAGTGIAGAIGRSHRPRVWRDYDCKPSLYRR